MSGELAIKNNDKEEFAISHPDGAGGAWYGSSKK